MDFSVRLSNSNMVMGNIKEMNSNAYNKENQEREILLDFLFEPKNKNEGYDSFNKM